MGCTAIEQWEIEQTVEPLARTAVAEGADLAKTQVARLASTAEAVAATQIAVAKGTAIAALSTKVADMLTPNPTSTPQPPKLARPLQPDDIVTYTVMEGDTLPKIATTYVLAQDKLIELNRDRYPSLIENPDHVEAGWVLIVATGSGGPISPPPPPAPASPEPIVECNETTVYWTDDFACEPTQLDAVTATGMGFGCIVLDDNPLGYYMVHTIYTGWVLTRNGEVFSYGWVYDKEKNEIAVGPAVVANAFKYLECGIPGNP